ncbi:hypothetical protein Droror1_Dr00006234 [Drosera rotundifolia]
MVLTCEDLEEIAHSDGWERRRPCPAAAAAAAAAVARGGERSSSEERKSGSDGQRGIRLEKGTVSAGFHMVNRMIWTVHLHVIPRPKIRAYRAELCRLRSGHAGRCQWLSCTSLAVAVLCAVVRPPVAGGFFSFHSLASTTSPLPSLSASPAATSPPFCFDRRFCFDDGGHLRLRFHRRRRRRRATTTWEAERRCGKGWCEERGALEDISNAQVKPRQLNRGEKERPGLAIIANEQNQIELLLSVLCDMVGFSTFVVGLIGATNKDEWSRELRIEFRSTQHQGLSTQ